MNHLPLLAETLSDVPDDFFKNTLLIGCQHLLPTVLDLINSVISKELDPKNIFLIGKCYSTNLQVVKELQTLGVNVSDKSSEYDSYELYENTFANNCTTFLKNIIKEVNFEHFDKIVILDDGGQLHTASNQLLPISSKFVGVEQTSKGSNILKSISLQYPVMNVARASPKLILEAPVIADIIIKNIAPYFGQDPNILIMGNGYIGNAIYKKLNEHLGNILVFDKDPEKNNFSENILIKSNKKDYFIIGATGENVLPQVENYGLLNKQVTLASVSSLDIEFNAIQFRRKKEKTNNCHENVVIDNVTLLNSGFPVNFSGKTNDFIDRSKFQLVNSLILSSMIYAIRSPNLPKQLIPMDKESQKFYAERYLSFMDT